MTDPTAGRGDVVLPPYLLPVKLNKGQTRNIDLRMVSKVERSFQNEFIMAATMHTATDPNWRGHEDEWRLTPVEPGTWAAMRLARKRTS